MTTLQDIPSDGEQRRQQLREHFDRCEGTESATLNKSKYVCKRCSRVMAFSWANLLRHVQICKGPKAKTAEKVGLEVTRHAVLLLDMHKTTSAVEQPPTPEAETIKDTAREVTRDVVRPPAVEISQGIDQAQLLSSVLCELSAIEFELDGKNLERLRIVQRSVVDCYKHLIEK